MVAVTAVSAAVPRALTTAALASAASLALTWEHWLLSLQTVLLWALLRKPFLLGACHLADTSRTLLTAKDDSCINEVSVSPRFAMLVLRVVGKRYLLVKWQVEYLLLGCSVQRGTCSTGRQLTNGDSGITST